MTTPCASTGSPDALDDRPPDLAPGAARPAPRPPVAVHAAGAAGPALPGVRAGGVRLRADDARPRGPCRRRRPGTLATTGWERPGRAVGGVFVVRGPAGAGRRP